jgi:hypothetical protein
VLPQLTQNSSSGSKSVDYIHIRKLQQQDKQLLALQAKYPNNYISLQLNVIVDDIICY